MRILGIDPGSRYTGWGVVDRRGSRLLAVSHGRIVLPRSQQLAGRLARLAEEMRQLVRAHSPDAAVLEALYYGVNPRSLIVLAQARGALLATVSEEGVEVHEQTASEIKSAVTGSGRADKQQVARMVRLILGLSEEIPDDTSDALAAAICFAQRLRLDRLGADKKPSGTV